MPADDLRKIEFGIERSRILELRVAGLASQRSSEPTDGLRVEAASEAGRSRQALKAEQRLQAGPAKIRRFLPGENVREAESRFEDGRRVPHPGVPDGGVL